MTIFALVIAFAAGFAFGFIVFRSERAYREGFRDGEHFGRFEGYRQAWLKRSKGLLNAETEDWND
jgi:hypothetical protein